MASKKKAPAAPEAAVVAKKKKRPAKPVARDNVSPSDVKAPVTFKVSGGGQTQTFTFPPTNGTLVVRINLDKMTPAQLLQLNDFLKGVEHETALIGVCKGPNGFISD
jgi:hypothetical protein